MKKKETKFIVLCDTNIFIDNNASNVIEALSKCHHKECDSLDFCDRLIPCVDMRVYNSKEDFIKDGGKLTGTLPGNLLADSTIDKWRVILAKDKASKNMVLFDVPYYQIKSHAERYGIDDLNEDDVFCILEHFVHKYATLKKINYDMDKANIKVASKVMYDILEESDKW